MSVSQRMNAAKTWTNRFAEAIGETTRAHVTSGKRPVFRAEAYWSNTKGRAVIATAVYYIYTNIRYSVILFVREKLSKTYFGKKKIID